MQNRFRIPIYGINTFLCQLIFLDFVHGNVHFKLSLALLENIKWCTKDLIMDDMLDFTKKWGLSNLCLNQFCVF